MHTPAISGDKEGRTCPSHGDPAAGDMMGWIQPITVLAAALLALTVGMKPQQVRAQPTSRSIAVLEIPEDDGSIDPIKTYGAEYLAQTAGIPFATTTSVESAASHALVIATSGIDGDTFSPSQRETLRTYVEQGGVFLAGNFKDPGLFDLFGITGEDHARTRHRINFFRHALPEPFDWMDEPREQTISLGDPDRDLVALSRSYAAGDAEVLAQFDDGSPAFTRHDYGDGVAYLLGVSLRDMTVRNQMNRDFTAQRTFSNGFEPSGDVFPLLVRSLFREHVENAVWTHTAPMENQSMLIVTHDVDSESGMVRMNQFAEYEQSQGITANYYITTRYIDDNLSPDYYTPHRDSIAKLHDQGQRIGSHSVGHFPDFDELPLGTLGNTQENYTPQHNGDETIDGTILGELEVSQALLEEDAPQEIVSFRAGHLLYPNRLVNGLDTLGYRYNSTYSANTVMTSFPYRNVKGRTFSGPLTEVWEVPMTISDVFRDEPISEENWPEKVDIWLDAFEKYAANGSPVVLLIHPDRGYKLDAEQSFVEQLPSDVAIVSTEAFGQFWKNRLSTGVETDRQGETLTIQLTNRQILPDSLSLVVDGGADLESITLQNEDGFALAHQTTPRPDGQLLIHSASPTGGDLLAEVARPVDADGNIGFGATGASLRFFGTSGSAMVTVQKFRGGPDGAEDIPEENVSDFRFVVTAGSGLGFDSTKVQLGIPSLAGVEAPDDIQIYRRETPDGGSFTALETKADDNGTPGDISDDTLSVTTDSFGEFVLASDSNPLPVEMSGFDAKSTGTKVRLTWTTASESGNTGFEVQRMSDGMQHGSWGQVGFVESRAPGGTTSEPTSYRFTDEDVPYGADSLRYRLRQVDADGSTRFTDPITIRRPVGDVKLLAPTPNPVRQTATIRYAVPNRQRLAIHLYDVLGRRVQTLDNGPRKGRHAARLDASDLPSGTYFLRLEAEHAVRTEKMTVIQ